MYLSVELTLLNNRNIKLFNVICLLSDKKTAQIIVGHFTNADAKPKEL